METFICYTTDNVHIILLLEICCVKFSCLMWRKKGKSMEKIKIIFS